MATAEMSEPRELFLHELRDILFAELTIEKMLGTLAGEASDQELTDDFEHHREETRGQIERLEKVFEGLGEKAAGTECPGILGIKAEHDEFVKDEKPSPEVLDMFLTGAAARTEHYEIAAYSGLITMAKALGEKDAEKLLKENLSEEEATLKKAEKAAQRLAKEEATASA